MDAARIHRITGRRRFFYPRSFSRPSSYLTNRLPNLNTVSGIFSGQPGSGLSVAGFPVSVPIPFRTSFIVVRLVCQSHSIFLSMRAVGISFENLSNESIRKRYGKNWVFYVVTVCFDGRIIRTIRFRPEKRVVLFLKFRHLNSGRRFRFRYFRRFFPFTYTHRIFVDRSQARNSYVHELNVVSRVNSGLEIVKTNEDRGLLGFRNEYN